MNMPLNNATPSPTHQGLPNAAELYQRRSSSFSSDLDYISRLVKSCPGNILEVGCGTGRVTKVISELSKKVYGIDIWKEALSLCQKNAPLARLWRQDVCTLKSEMQFDLVLLPFNVLELIGDTNRKKQALHKIYDHLNINGQLYIDTYLFDKKVFEKSSELKQLADIALGGGQTARVFFEATRNLSQKISNSNFRYVVIDSDTEEPLGEVSDSYTVTPVTSEELLFLLNETGFEVNNFYADYDGHKINIVTDLHAVVTCHRS